MKTRRSTAILGSIGLLLCTIIVFVFVWFWPRADSVYGLWHSTTSYQGNPPGAISFVFKQGGRVQVFADRASAPWWAAPIYDLQFRGETIEVWSGKALSGELQFKKRGQTIDLIDRSSPTRSLRLRKS